MKRFGFALVGLMLFSEVAYAASCSGVEWRVNARTRQLEMAVKNRIEQVETALVNQERLERERLLAALKVMTKQESASSTQTAQMMQDSSKAQSSAYVTQRQNLAVLSARERYASVGYDPCSLASKAGSFYQASRSADGVANGIANVSTFSPGEFGNPRAWALLVKGSSSYSAGSLFSGNAGEAKDYISVLLGPSEKANPTIKNTAAGSIARLDKNYRDAHKSLIVTVLAGIAADNVPGGIRETGFELSKHWIGDDGGKAWFANSADQQLRGVLQDAVRIEAANISVLAQRIKRMGRSEMAAASLLLTLVNDLMPKLPVDGHSPDFVKASVRQ